MKFSTVLLISASAALTSATGPEYDPETNTWKCHVADAVYCAGDSLKTNIIIRCTGLVGQPGNCNNNLAGQPPMGVHSSVCYSPGLHSAACAKNCIVYGGSGNLDGDFALPAELCTPAPTQPTTYTVPEPTLSTISPTYTDKPTVTPTTTDEPEPTTTDEPEPTATTDEPEPTTTDEPEPTTTTDEPEPTTTKEPEPTLTDRPPHTDEPTVIPPTTITVTISNCATTPIPPAPTNGTTTAHPTGGNTNTPIGPSSTILPPIPGAGVTNEASFGMLVLAAAVALAV
ncbi:hypothetical protein V493_05290 [Pseudogymnoascus sp. VKM F-4281 (FW-2241)]|nr:hypothetical protein V493_05290 [Pseudogymnoascus sp. VKM F-4281 (FW-2241)]